jgi:hypothetical protein
VSRSRFAIASRAAGVQGKQSRRNAVVLATLISSLTLTSVLLLALAPAPLTPDAPSLLVTDSTDSFAPIFDTRKPIQPARWKYIFLHHTKGKRGDALSIGGKNGFGDHFLIGNGDGCGDGEIQIGARWTSQQGARPIGASLADNSISICIVGDFDQSNPTPAQIRNLQRLIQTLQRRFGISGRAVLASNKAHSTAGIGIYFPSAQLSRQILP